MATFVVRDKTYDCHIALTLDLIGGKWKTLILWYLLDGKKRFGELKKLLPKCTQRMLTHQLRELERDGIVKRKIFRQIPPKVEYSLTRRGETLRPILQLACNWGTQWADDADSLPMSAVGLEHPNKKKAVL
ncbi:MAG: helix-turn-helix transcriptional regulator [Ignavibacteria bacterium]|jgi:DNA-binding HxlR family transcriptional regulator|nr:helix-turn-helix transcriptional regulator [Ignavibacteria bacterium]